MSALTVTFDSEISIVTTIKELARLRRESRDIFSNEESMLSFMQLCEMLPGDAENREGK